MTHICVGTLTIIGSDNGLSPDRRQAIIWTNDGILLIGPLGRNKLQWNLKRNSYIFIQENAFENLVLKMAAILFRPQCVKQTHCVAWSRFLNHRRWAILIDRCLEHKQWKSVYTSMSKLDKLGKAYFVNNSYPWWFTFWISIQWHRTCEYHLNKLNRKSAIVMSWCRLHDNIYALNYHPKQRLFPIHYKTKIRRRDIACFNTKNYLYTGTYFNVYVCIYIYI